MVRISDTKPGRRDGGYTRVFNNPDIGSVVSRIQGTTIRAGTELEQIIHRESESNETAIEDLDKFLANGEDGIFIAGKSSIKASTKIYFEGAEPDYLIFEKKGVSRRCFVMELKDGDTFDTKKSGGEVSTLRAFTQSVGSTLTYSTEIRICSFNQSDKRAIVQGFKRTVDESLVWTGREFCELMGFDYDAIVSERRADAEANRRFFIEQLLEIDAVREIAKEVLGDV